MKDEYDVSWRLESLSKRTKTHAHLYPEWLRLNIHRAQNNSVMSGLAATTSMFIKHGLSAEEYQVYLAEAKRRGLV